MTTTGGLDLFPPDPAIVPDDYTASMDAVGIAYDVLDAAEVTRRWPAFRLPPGTTGAAPGGRRDRARRPRHRRDAGAGAPARRRPARRSARARAGRPRRRRGRGRDGRTARSARGGVVVTADAWTNDVLGHLGVQRAARGDAGSRSPTSRPTDPARFAPGRAAAVDLDGRPVVLRVPHLRRADGQGRAGLRRPGRRPRRPRTGGHRPRRCWRGCTASWATLLPGSRRPGAVASAASTR